MKRIALTMLLSVATGALLAAQMYRWVDEKGNVEYRDTPPPANAKKSEKRNISGSTIQTSTPSYSAQQAAQNFPVTLWAYDCGDPCKNARAHLARRGVPYTEKDPKGDLKAFEKLTGSTGVPVLFVGSSRLQGYLESDWENTLDAAGYPRTAAGTTAAAKPAAKPEAKPAPKADVEQKPAAEVAPPPTTAGSDRSVPYAPGRK